MAAALVSTMNNGLRRHRRIAFRRQQHRRRVIYCWPSAGVSTPGDGRAPIRAAATTPDLHHRTRAFSDDHLPSTRVTRAGALWRAMPLSRLGSGMGMCRSSDERGRDEERERRVALRITIACCASIASLHLRYRRSPWLIASSTSRLSCSSLAAYPCLFSPSSPPPIHRRSLIPTFLPLSILPLHRCHTALASPNGPLPACDRKQLLVVEDAAYSDGRIGGLHKL